MKHRYSSVAILLHWLIALTMAFQMALGFALPRDESGFAAYQLHKSVGCSRCCGLGWRLVHRPPPGVEGGFTGFLAKAFHPGFYVVLVFAPLTGWVLVSTAEVRVPTVLFGIVQLPHLPLPTSLYEVSEEAHELLSWIGIALFVLHVAGALRHHLLIRDRLLERMAPARSAALVGVLTTLVLAISDATRFLASGSGPIADEGEERLASFRPATTEETRALSDREGIEVRADALPTARGEAAEVEDAPGPATQATEPGPLPVWSIQPGGRLGVSVRSGDDTVRESFAD